MKTNSSNSGRNRWVSAAVLGAAQLFASCSLGPPVESVVRVEMPMAQQAAIASYSDPLASLQLPAYANSSQTTVAQPTVFEEFTCFGLNVTGSGIAGDPRVSCPNDSMGMLGGLAPISGGFVEMTIPAGPARRIQLFAVKSLVGCPSLPVLLDQSASGQGDAAFDGIGDPYLIGETTADVFSDTTVTIAASYDPATSPQLFTKCGGGNQNGTVIPIAAAYAGKYTGSYMPSIEPSPFPTVPVVATGAPEIGGVAMASTEISKMATFEQGTPGGSPPLDYNLAAVNLAPGTYMSIGERAAIQIHWDVTNVDFVANPNMEIQIELGGGIYSNPTGCSAPAGVGVQAAVFNGSTSQWIPGYLATWDSVTNSLNWNSFRQSPASLVWTKSDGRKYIIVNVESNFVGGSLPSCGSMVAVSGAQLRVMPVPDPLQVSPSGVTVAPGNGYHFGAWGGVPPYSFSLVSGGGSLLNDGTYFAPATAGTAIIRVTDNAGNFADSPVTIGAGGGGFPTLSWSGTAALVSGSCSSFTITASSAPTVATTINVNDSMGGSFYSNMTDCTGYISQTYSFSMAAATNAVTIWYQSSVTGSATLNAFATNMGQGSYGISVTAAPTQLVLTEMSAISVGTCTPIQIQARDMYANAANVSSMTTVNLSMNLSPTPGSAQLYSDSGCISVTGAVVIPAGANTAIVYIKPTTAGQTGNLAATDSSVALATGNLPLTF